MKISAYFATLLMTSWCATNVCVQEPISATPSLIQPTSSEQAPITPADAMVKQACTAAAEKIQSAASFITKLPDKISAVRKTVETNAANIKNVVKVLQGTAVGIALIAGAGTTYYYGGRCLGYFKSPNEKGYTQSFLSDFGMMLIGGSIFITAATAAAK